MRGVRSVRSGQQQLEGIETVQAIRRDELWALPRVPPGGLRGAARAQDGVAPQRRLAGERRLAG
jgi:hypothetical protein